MIDINDYIDFKKLFIDLYKNQKDLLEEYKDEVEHFKKIIDFNNRAFNEFELIQESSSLSDKEIVFYFGLCLGGANESNNEDAYANFIIRYDRTLNEFISCEYEQG